MAGVDAIVRSQAHGGTALGAAVAEINRITHDRLIVVTDEQTSDRVPDAVARHAYSCRRFRVEKLLIETKATGITVAQEIRRLYKEEDWNIEMITPKTDKVARTHGVEPTFAARMIYAPDIEWAEKVIAQSEVFPKGKNDNIHDTTTQAIGWLRHRGFLAHDHEIAAEMADAMQHKSKAKPLYEA
jgi:predicted phage terminase large subunit-like protein